MLAKRRGEAPEQDEDTASLPEASEPEAGTDEPQESFKMMAYARVFSGTLVPGQEVYLLAPKFNPNHPEKFSVKATITKLYMFMGTDLREMEAAPAGTIVGILGLADNQGAYKSMTVASSLQAPSFAGLNLAVKPIVRVALDPERIRDMPALQEGMRKLCQADTCAEVVLQETGELVLVAAGEVHIERCLTDLREVYAPGVKINVSKPIIPFRETIIPPPKMDLTNEAIGEENTIVGSVRKYLVNDDLVFGDNGSIVLETTNKHWTLHVRADPLPASVVEILKAKAGVLRDLFGRSETEADVNAADIASGWSG